MNTPVHAMQQAAANGSMPSVGLATDHKLPQPGGRPLVFSGSELAMAMSYTPGIPYWFEINIYLTDMQEVVVAIRKFFQSETQTDHVNAWSFSSLDMALDHIQTYDAAIDVHVPDVDFEAMTAAEMSAMALSLKAEVTSLRHHFAGLVGELFLEIETADASLA